MSELVISKKRSHIYILNNKDPNTDPEGTPGNRPSHLLYGELIFVLYFLLLRKIEISLR